MTPDWGLWSQHDGSSRNKDIPALPGVYRIRRVGRQGLDYIGQATHLRRRMGNLNGIYGDLMPYNAPHTAGPGFWAFSRTKAVTSRSRSLRSKVRWLHARASNACWSPNIASNTASRRR